MKNSIRFLVALGSFCALGSVGWSQNIDTFPLWNNSNAIDAWGGGGTPTYGQTFTPNASQTALSGIRFSVRHINGVADDFQAFVYRWNGTTITGGALYAGPVPTGTVSNASFQNYDVNTGAVALTPGLQYVAFYTTTTTIANGGSSVWAYLGTSPQSGSNGYAGGNFVFNNGATFADLTSGWDNPIAYGGSTGDDLAFRLSFVPEPASAVSMIVGLALAATTFGRRNRRN